MNRTTGAIIGALAGVAILAGAKLGVTPVALAADDAGRPAADDQPSTLPVDGNPGRDDASPSPSASLSPSASPSESSSAEPTSSPSDRPSPSPTGEPTSRPTPSRTPSRPSEPSGVFRGDGDRNVYGTVQVTIIVDNGRIIRSTATFPDNAPTSALINSRAVPRLNAAVLTAQSAAIDAVSGATFTSSSYRDSLQSAIDRARS
ncbi:FMN-binding protein [Pilimelia columellifera]|uniref:FMN-binding domain-containing protein n=1 Tax=Pilimelia columellifera subsp. columellifera TaxID=706583 RepID=A0ABN3N2K1_9ACTN